MPTAPPPLVTNADLAAYLGVAELDLNAPQASMACELASGLTRDYTDQRLDKVVGTVAALPGRGGTILLVPELPLLAVTDVTLAGDADPLVVDDDYRVEVGNDGMMGALVGAANWPTDRDVVVTYDHGYELDRTVGDGDAHLPDGVRAAVLRIAGRGYSNPTEARQESIGRYSVSYGTTGSPGLYLSGQDRKALDGHRTTRGR